MCVAYTVRDKASLVFIQFCCVQILPTAQRLLDELLSSQSTAINTVCGAPGKAALMHAQIVPNIQLGNKLDLSLHMHCDITTRREVLIISPNLLSENGKWTNSILLYYILLQLGGSDASFITLCCGKRKMMREPVVCTEQRD